MRVLITGAAGFVGAEIATALAGEGMDVVASYRHSMPPSHLARLPRVTLRRIDWLEPVVAFPVDAIVHAAATSPAPGVTDDMITRDSVVATENLLNFAASAGANRFIYLSSLSVYGRINDAQVDEETPIRDPNAYGAAKRDAEMLVETACGRNAGSAVGLSVRLPGVIGPGAARNWLATVASRLRADRQVEIYNPDAPFNNAVHVNDLARWSALLMRTTWSGYDRVTLGARGVTTVRQTVERLAAGIGSRSPIVVEPSPRNSFIVSSDRARMRYGYDPMSIDDMLDRYATETLQSPPT